MKHLEIIPSCYNVVPGKLGALELELESHDRRAHLTPNKFNVHCRHSTPFKFQYCRLLSPCLKLSNFF